MGRFARGKSARQSRVGRSFSSRRPASSAPPRSRRGFRRRKSLSDGASGARKPGMKQYLEVKMGGKQLSGKLKTRRDTARVRSAPRTRSYIYSKSGSSRKAIYSANSQRK